ncbi:DUF4190 domain-containing protein [Streptomyces sp. NPDC051913]|uniref:DUF4190 domain-containing protein n=1 Tax=Streptomyces sp. NPDC051913 TaxID=3365676 RepID=UPI0037CE042E
MSDEAQTPDPIRDRSTPPPAPKVGLGKPDGAGETVAGASVAGTPVERDPWAPPAGDAGAMPTVSAEEVPLSGEGSASPGGAGGAGGAGGMGGPGGTSVPSGPGGPGGTVVSNDPLSWPPPSVHDQRTVTSMPGADGTTPGGAATPTPDSGTPAPQPWANPFAAPGGPATGPTPDPANPFAPPHAGPTPNPFAAPTGPTGPAPYAPDAASVPPPPIAPDGPGQLPYGYPGGGYGYPGQPQGHPAQAQGYPGQPQGYYGWPGMQPLPANGMGTAGLVLGILSAIVFCLWPLAIILGILGVIFGSIGRGKASKGTATNPGQALAGIICGAVGIVLGVGMLVLLAVT